MKVLAVALLAAGFGLLDFAESQAQSPLPDLPCRRCHTDLNEELVLPSGQPIPLEISIATLNRSPHSYRGQEPVFCTDCHTNKEYSYPHPTVPAETSREYTQWVSQSCNNCHYPHSPLHPADGSQATMPSCVDCHGSHDVAPAEQIGSEMPANCVQCHADRPVEWAAALIGPRPGFGEGAQEYIGSDRCLGCHEDLYSHWQETLHANTIQDVSLNPAAVLGDFSGDHPVRLFNLDAVDYTLGQRWKQLYLAVDEESGKVNILPAKWIVATAEWGAYAVEAEQTEWLQECSSCHVTGLDIKTWTFEEFGVGCERCHGPGKAHAADPEQVEMFAAVDDQVCGSCHSQGHSPEGHTFPAGYEPGDTLSDHFRFAEDESFFWPDGSAKVNAMQYMDWRLGNAMQASQQVNCATCHAVHDAGKAQGQLREPLNTLCTNCHGDKEALVLHTPFHRVASERFDFACTDCHMPKMATSAVAFDIHSHTFHQPDVEASLAHGVEAMPNACNLCHTDMSAEWASDTLTYVATVTTPAPAALFGPGPTPTPPPPPTPLPNVGEPSTQIQSPSDTWVRYAFLTVLALSLLGILYAFVRIMRSREPASV
jgi:predicted CXXCH cytochrome family protein